MTSVRILSQFILFVWFLLSEHSLYCVILIIKADQGESYLLNWYRNDMHDLTKEDSMALALKVGLH